MLRTLPALAQETVFNVPSGDILDPGKAYVELDTAYVSSNGSCSFTPRIVVGAAHGIELGLNVSGLVTGAAPQTTLTPAMKWKVYDGGGNGWFFLTGDNLFIPIQNRTYRAGNYAYAEFAKTWRTKTRATFGVYAFTPHVLAPGSRAGGQFAIEQPIGDRFTLAADWYTGDHALAYVSPGVIFKATSKLTVYGTYEIGNGGALARNRQLVVEAGWNFH